MENEKMKKSKVKFNKVFPSTMKVNQIYVDLNSWKLEIPVNLLTKDKTDFTDIIITSCEDIIYNDKVLFKKNEEIPFSAKSSNANGDNWQNWDIICFDFLKDSNEDFNKSLLKNETVSLQFTV